MKLDIDVDALRELIRWVKGQPATKERNAALAVLVEQLQWLTK